MANKYAGGTGNWSEITWLDAHAGSPTTAPASGDTAYANGYTVTIDGNITCTALTTATYGGGFSVTTARTITASVTAGTTACVVCSHTTGTVAITGTIQAGTSASAYGVQNSNAGTVNISGNVTGGTNDYCYGVYNSSTGTVNITGNVLGNNNSSYGVYNYSTGTANITGNVTGGDGHPSAYGAVNNNVSGTLNITGNIIFGAKASPIFGSNMQRIFWTAGSQYYMKYGTVKCPQQLAAAQIAYGVAHGDLTGTLDVPAVANVRDGITYNAGASEGVLNLPAEAEVKLGVSFDNGGKTGTYREYRGLPESLLNYLAAYYKMNDNAADTVIYNEAGINGSSQQNTEDIHNASGLIDSALAFNGTSDYINTNQTFQSTFRNGFSVNIWAKATDGIKENLQALLGQYVFTTGIVDFIVAINIFGRITAYIETESGAIASVTEDSASFVNGANEFKMITVNVVKNPDGDDTARIDLYVNGVLRKTGAVEIISLDNYTQTSNLAIGAILDGSNVGSFFEGLIDETSIFSKNLSTAEIRWLYNNKFLNYNRYKVVGDVIGDIQCY